MHVRDDMNAEEEGQRHRRRWSKWKKRHEMREAVSTRVKVRVCKGAHIQHNSQRESDDCEQK